VVSCLDSAQKALGLQWQWDADSDEAGYMPDRNFAALQTNMAAFLKRLAISQLKAIDARGATGLQLFMSDGFGAEPREGEIFTHIGPVTAETLQRWAEASGDAQITNAAAFFPWWGKGFDGGFYRGLALYELWSQCRWAPPLDDAEREQIKRSISWCTEAQKLGAPPPIPESELAELRALATSDAPQPIKREGTGFRRRMWRWSIGDNWALRMPGEMVSSIEGEDDDPTYVFSTNDLDIRASVYVAPSDDPDIRAGAFDREISMVERRIERLNQTVAARTLAKTFAQGDRTRVCVLTITSTTPETRDLGQTIGQSLTFEPD
jgi:hypothetical protein